MGCELNLIIVEPMTNNRQTVVWSLLTDLANPLANQCANLMLMQTVIMYMRNLRLSMYSALQGFKQLPGNRLYVVIDAPAALMNTNLSEQEYFSKILKADERNMIRKAEKREYYCKGICYDDYLDDIHEINLSKLNRQGPMPEYYATYPCAREKPLAQLGADIISFGCFKEDTLVAYVICWAHQRNLVIDRILGHGEHLRHGIMNLLFYYTFQQLAQSETADYLNYQFIFSDSNSAFKRRVGFQEHNLILEMDATFLQQAAAEVRNPFFFEGDVKESIIQRLSS